MKWDREANLVGSNLAICNLLTWHINVNVLFLSLSLSLSLSLTNGSAYKYKLVCEIIFQLENWQHQMTMG